MPFGRSMNIFVLLASVVLTGLAVYLKRGALPVLTFSVSRLTGYATLLVIVGAVGMKFQPPLPVAAGMLLGFAAVLVPVFNSKASLESALVAVAATLLIPEPKQSIPFLMLAYGMGALFFEFQISIAAIAVFGTALLGFFTTATLTMPNAPILVGISAGFASLLTARLDGEAKRAWVVSAITIIASAIVCKFGLSDMKLLYVAVISGVTALIVHWLTQSDSEENSLTVLIASLLWLGLATVAFGLSRGFGVGLSLVIGAIILSAFNNRRALLTLGPAVGILFYRIYKEMLPDLAKALELGQHYAIIGLIFGMILPLAALEWKKRYESVIGVTLWGVGLFGSVPLLVIVLGAKGLIGMLFGLGLGSLVGKQAQPSLLGVSAGVAAFSIIGSGWMKSMLELTRDERIRYFAYGGGTLLFVAIFICVLSLRSSKEVTV